MDSWHRNVRLLHQIDEFLDVDPNHPHFVADFIALIDAVREGLFEVDEGIRIPDSQINLHFLTKLKSRPEWKEWAMAMLRDSRINASNVTHCMPFRQLADLALKQERTLLQEQRAKRTSGSSGKDSGYHSDVPQTPRSVTQSEINTFVVREMRNQRDSRRHSQLQVPHQKSRGHMKRPSQEEINEYVIRQMRQDKSQLQRTRSQSQPAQQVRYSLPPKPKSNRCNFCGDTYHQSTHCWRRWRMAAEALQGNPSPKLLETRAGLLAQPQLYFSGLG